MLEKLEGWIGRDEGEEIKRIELPERKGWRG